MKACSFPVPVCAADTGCLLAGYSAGKDGSWEMGFSRAALQWGMGSYSLPGGNQGTYIEIRSVDPSCQSRQGTAGDDTCQERFVWGSFSLKPLWNY